MNIGSTWMNPNGDTIADWTRHSIDGGHAVALRGLPAQERAAPVPRPQQLGQRLGRRRLRLDLGGDRSASSSSTAYKVVVTDTSRAGSAPERGPTALTDDDCGESQLVDSVTGQCAEMCPDDSRPANGQCDTTGAGHPH